MPELAGNMNIVEGRQDLQPSIEGKDSPKSYITTEREPVKIENNSKVHVVNITTCGKCNSHVSESCGETSNVTSLCNQLTNINIDITNNFGIIIISPNGQFCLDVQPNNTIEEVKSKIQSKEGITSAEQRLYFGREHLRDDRTLTSYHVKHGSSVQLVLRLRGGFRIFVRNLCGQTKELQVNYETTISELKEKISHCEDIPPEQQRLIYAGTQLEDDRTLAYYDIFSLATIHLALRLRGGDPRSLQNRPPVNTRRSTRCKCIIL